MSRRWLVAVSIAAHLSIVVGLVISGAWNIERLEAGRRRIDLGVQPLPPPAPPGGPVPAVTVKLDPKHKHVVKGPTQPVVQPPEPLTTDRDSTEPGTGSGSGDRTDTGTCTENCSAQTAPPADPVCGNGSLEAGEQCDDGNTLDGDGCSSSCRTEPKRPQTAVIAPSLLQALRISGETQLHPGAVTQNQMVRDGVSRVEALVTVCVTPGGGVGSTAMRTSTGYEAYDQILLSAVRGWRYRPYMVNGAPVPACSVVRFIYTIQ